MSLAFRNPPKWHVLAVAAPPAGAKKKAGWLAGGGASIHSACGCLLKHGVGGGIDGSE